MARIDQFDVQYKKEDIFRVGEYNPALVEMDKAKLKKLRPKSFKISTQFFDKMISFWSWIRDLLKKGDILTAVVVSTQPLLVACHSEDVDAVVLQCFPTELGKKMGWETGSRLLAAGGYNFVSKNKDIDFGPKADKKWKSFTPIIADLYAADMDYVERKKKEIPDEYWKKTEEMGRAYMVKHPGKARDGIDGFFKDAVKISQIKFDRKMKID